MSIVNTAIKYRIVSCLLHMSVLKLYSWIVLEELLKSNLLLPVKYVKNAYIKNPTLYISEKAFQFTLVSFIW